VAAWKETIFSGWRGVRIEEVEALESATHRVGDRFALRALVRLGSIAPGEVAVEAYFGSLDAERRIVEARSQALELVETVDASGGLHRYAGSLPCDHSGRVGYTVRVRPSHPDANNVLSTGLMTWR
jgi:starch phosphorylase